jgi:hypothetical protein
MSFSLVIGLCLLPPDTKAISCEPRLDERLLARVPDSLALEGKPERSPDGRTTVPNVQPVVWSPDGAAVGFVGLAGERPKPVLLDKVLGDYDYASGPVFSRDGQHSAFRVGKRVGKDRERWWVLLDGKETGVEDWMGEIALAPSGGGYAVWTQPGARIAGDGSYDSGAQVLATPWKHNAKKWEDASSFDAPRFAPDGSFVTAIASKGGQWRLVIADKKGERELGKPQSFLAGYDVSADGKSFALVVLDAAGADPDMPPMPGMQGGKCVILFGKETLGRDRDNAERPRLSPDGTRLAWVFREKGKHGLALGEDERREARHDWIKCAVFRPDGKEIAFAAGTGGKANEALLDPEGGMQVDGAQWKLVRRPAGGDDKASDASYADILHVTWSPDGKRLAFLAKGADGWRVVCADAKGERKSDAFDELGPPRFHSGGKHLAFGARKGRELWWKVMELAP